MKKLAVILIGLFTIFGGVMLSSCGKEVKLSVDTTSVVIFTNDDDAENFQKKTVKVNLENSDAGVYLEVTKGEDVVHLSSRFASRVNDGEYSFTIHASRSGSAQVKVSSVEDMSQSQTIDVTVNTVIENISDVQADSVNNRSNKFAILENPETAEGKSLVFDEFFSFEPLTANINDVAWTFFDNEDVADTQLTDTEGRVLAEIMDDKLFVYDNFESNGGKVRLKAYFVQNPSIFDYVDFDILQNATISKFTLNGTTSAGAGEQTVIGENPSSSLDFVLKRNDAELSNVTGYVEVNSAHPVDLQPVFVRQTDAGNFEMSEAEYARYFSFDLFDVREPDEGNGKYTYNFVISALDTENNLASGTFFFYLRAQYREYEHAVDTSARQAKLSVAYTVESVQVSNMNGDVLNDAKVDVYSSYAGAYGYGLHVMLRPENLVAATENHYRLSVNLRQNALRNLRVADEGGRLQNVTAANLSKIVKFFDANGREIVLSSDNPADENVYASGRTSNEVIYICAGEGIETVVPDLEVAFVSESVSPKTANVKFDLYRIGGGTGIEVTEFDGREDVPLADRFISSSRSNTTRTLEYQNVTINGFSSLNGLSVVASNTSRFVFSALERVSYETDETPSMVVNFKVTLVGFDFDASTTFHFQHVTGRQSEEFSITAFVPLDEASLENANKQSSSVFEEEYADQSFVLQDGDTRVGEGVTASRSLSRLVLEAGTNLPIQFNSSAISQIEVRFLPMWTSVRGGGLPIDTNGYYNTFLRIMAELGDQYPDLTTQEAAEQFFRSEDAINILATRYFDRFGNVDSTLFSLNSQNSRLTISNNAFKGFVCVMFKGWAYEEGSREQITLARFFALESLFSVRTLSSNVKESTIYTAETLSIPDASLASVNVMIALRNDQNIPTYTNNLSYFKFVSSTLQGLYGDTGFDVTGTGDGTNLDNDYYSISRIRFTSAGRFLEFTITAKSTMFNPTFDDVLTIYYDHRTNAEGGFVCKTDIVLHIRNVNRVESVTWSNATEDGQIYLNTRSQNDSERSFTIAASVQPSEAYDTSLRYVFDQQYATNPAAANNFEIYQSGQTFNLTLGNSASGGYGYVYLLPSDMVKRVNGLEQVLAYEYDSANDTLVAKYAPLSRLPSIYDDLVGNDGTDENAGQYCSYFLNNNGERVYNRDVILKIRVIFADGSNEETAIRLYTAQELQNLSDTTCFYQIMNNLVLSDWQTIPELTGGIFGRDENITLTFTGNSHTFVGRNLGLLRDLTFAGNLTGTGEDFYGSRYAGYIANVNVGNMQNLYVDVHYSAAEDKFLSSKLEIASTEALSAVGGLVGLNRGNIDGLTAAGLSIDAQKSAFVAEGAAVGGLVGRNEGAIVGSNFQFFQFVEEVNTIMVPTEIVVGGLVGFASQNSTITRSYVYAYPLSTPEHASDVVINASQIGAFVGVNQRGAQISESFAFLGNVQLATCSPSSTATPSLTVRNSYIAYRTSSTWAVNFYVTGTDEEPFVLTATEGDLYERTILAMLSQRDAEGDNIWAVGDDVDSNINFGFMHLAKTTQDVEVDVTALTINDNFSPLQSLGVEGDMGVLFRYALAQQNVMLSDADKSALENRNTISLQNLFALDLNPLSSRQARGLLVSSSSSNLTVASTSVRVNNTSFNEIELAVRSKTDMTRQKTFKVLILNYLPTIDAVIGENHLQDGQVVLLQKSKTQSVIYQLDNAISLNGTMRLLAQDEYSINFNHVDADGEEIAAESHFKVERNSSTSLLLSGLESHSAGEVSHLRTFVEVAGLGVANEKYADGLAKIRERNFSVSVYDGATALAIENAEHLSFKVSENATFDVVMTSDSAADELVFELEFDGSRYTLSDGRFDIDEHLSLDVTTSKIETLSDGRTSRYRVLVKVSENKKHLVAADYANLKLFVNALSKVDDKAFAQQIVLSVLRQKVEDVSISFYGISDKTIFGSVMYYRMSSNILNTLPPSSDAIMAMTVSPAFAQMTHFTLTHDAPSSAITISRLQNNPSYGFHGVMDNTSIISNGLRVNLTDADRQGDGVFYFRVYVSSLLASDQDLTFTASFYGDDQTYVTSQNVVVDFMPEAEILVEGKSSYLMPRGSTATVSVRVGIDQELYGLSLQGAGGGITLSSWRETEQVSSYYKEYTATLTAYVSAQLQDGSSYGEFTVNAQVARVINGIQDIKTSRATIMLVDFTIDEENISLSSLRGTQVVDGQEYDVFQSYVQTQDALGDVLSFNYPLLPERYLTFNAQEEEIANALIAERRKFQIANNYANPESEYYINHRFDSTLGQMAPLALKQQLDFVEIEGGRRIYTPIYNEGYGNIVQQRQGLFRISSDYDSQGNEQLRITGLKTGSQLMRLRTTVYFQGAETTYTYLFLIVVDVWSDEEIPTQIFTGQEFVDFATNSEQADDYILMNDIVLDEYTPLDTTLIKSLDGNGFTIHLNSFNIPESGDLNLALFNRVTAGTTLKNVRVNVYGAGQISVDLARHKKINIAGFAITNEGIIYNCEVVSYRSEHQTVSRPSSGIVVTYTTGANADAYRMTEGYMQNNNIESAVAGFAITNNASIVNSRVGGENFQHIVEIGGRLYVQTQQTDTFVIQGQGGIRNAGTGGVAGFVISNEGQISASFAKNVQINNQTNSINSITAGFVISNISGSVQTSYVEGRGVQGSVTLDLLTINSMGQVAGFVFSNGALVKNCYANIAFEYQSSRPAYSAGFVYINARDAQVNLCFSGCRFLTNDINQMPFSGVDQSNQSLNQGSITFSYFYNDVGMDTTNQNKFTSGAIAVDRGRTAPQEQFYGFSFASSEDEYDGIWSVSATGKISLVAANKIALSNRYASSVGNVLNFLYNNTILDADTFETYNLAYGSENNPIIIRNARDFALATGDTNVKGGMSAYREYFNDNEVYGTYRLVQNIDLAEIDQDIESEESDIAKLSTTTKTFTSNRDGNGGIFDGNGFSISNLNLNLNANQFAEDRLNFGLFAKLDDAVIMNLDIKVVSVNGSKSGHIVGTLAGTAIDSRIVAITIEKASEQQTDLRIVGNNIVGGVVGAVLGTSRIIDAKVEGIEVEASYWDNSKKVGDNADALGMLRSSIDANDIPACETLSYGGAIAGLVDVNNNIQNADYAFFEASLSEESYDIISVKARQSVKVKAEIAGGLFGYLGKTTYVYDASVVLNASSALDSPSYITAENLYAGGIVGESYGALFATYAKYDDEIQTLIEEGEAGYYSSGNALERGQQTIFSHTSYEPETTQSQGNPLFVGGLVGFMGGGYIYKSYNKLNVISYSDKTLAVGGIVGAMTSTGNSFVLKNVIGRPSVDAYFDEVYASGDVGLWSNTSDSLVSNAGLIGAFWSAGYGTPRIALTKSLAVNYRSVDRSGGNIMDDKTHASGGNKESDSHFVLIGRAYQGDSLTLKGGNSQIASIEQASAVMPYIIDSYGGCYDTAANSFSGNEIGTKTVGGFDRVVFGDNTIFMKFFGFGDLDQFDQDSLVSMQPMGDRKMSTMSAAYSYLAKYFLQSDWDEKYWEHKQDHLFPELRILPLINEAFWDMDNTEEVLEVIANNPYATIVVRGREYHDDENCTKYGDIDLRSVANVAPENLFETFKNFSGTLISLSAYTEDSESYTINSDAQPYGVGGEKNADEPGLILDKPLFKEAEHATVRGLNIYFCAANETDVIDYSLVEDEEGSGLLNSSFLFNNFVLNSNLVLNAKQGRAGLIAGRSISTSYVSNEITVRGDSTITMSADGVAGSDKVAIGLLTGELAQASQVSNTTVADNRIVKQNADAEKPVLVSVDLAEDFLDVSAGLFIGRAVKETASEGLMAKLILGISSLDSDVLFVVNKHGTETNSVENLRIGGFMGSVEGADSISASAGRIDAGSMRILLGGDSNSSVGTLEGGLAFGEVASSAADMSIQTGQQLFLRGGIYQVATGTTPVALKVSNTQLGAFAGQVNFIVKIGSLNAQFEVAKIRLNNLTNFNNFEEALPQYMLRDASGRVLDDLFEKNLQDYSSFVREDGTVLALSPFEVSGSSADTAIGGVVGYAKTGSNLTFIGKVDVAGNLDVAVQTDDVSPRFVDVGGLIGKFHGSLTIKLSSDGVNKINISVKQLFTSESKPNGFTANVGGMIGEVVETGGEGGTSATMDINADPNNAYVFAGNVLSNVKSLNFGGAVGKLNATGFESDLPITISRTVFGGALKVWGADYGDEVTAGGVVGDWLLADHNPDAINYTISHCFTYGDVFVNYDEESLIKLSKYNFGGIVGSANYINIQNSVSLMTNFNNRLTADENRRFENGKYKVGAIVGASAGIVNYDSNAYSSMVCMAYQVEEGNIDRQYLKGEDAYKYFGYSSYVPDYDESGVLKVDESNIIDGASGDGLWSSRDIFEELITKNLGYMLSGFTGDATCGEKLNPYSFDNHTSQISTVDGIYYVETDENQKKLSSTHNISWLALTNDFTGDEVRTTPLMADSNAFVNMAFVGNGRRMQVSDTRGTSGSAGSATMGALVDVMGKAKTSTEPSVNFSMISGLIVDLDVVADVTEDGSYGGVVGQMNGNAFIYGVGVEGDLSVGGGTGSAHNVNLAGIAGQMQSGLINECYVDANIVYRNRDARTVRVLSGVYLEDYGHVSGVANVSPDLSIVPGTLTLRVSAIKATYSAGEIKTYVDAPVYTFASVDFGGAGYDRSFVWLIDVYSYANVVTQIVSGNVGNYTPMFVKENGRGLNAESFNQAINASYGVQIGASNAGITSDASQGYNYSAANASSMAVSYTGIGKSPTSSGTTDKPNAVYNLRKGGDETTHTQWYFSPFTNNGYASHGFGYLKNVSTYTRKVTNADKLLFNCNLNADGTRPDDYGKERNASPADATAVPQYEYQAVAYGDILTSGGRKELYTVDATNPTLITELNKWFLGVANYGKLNQMIDTISDATSASSSKPFRFVLQHDIDMAPKNDGTYPSVEQFSMGSISRVDLIFDGNNKTLDFANKIGRASAFFNSVKGIIENLKLNDVNVSGAATLATTMTGELTNVTVVGNLTASSAATPVGGVVGTLNGSATAVTSLVNITTEHGGIVGGVVGKFVTADESAKVDGNNIVRNGRMTYSSSGGQIIVTGFYNNSVPFSSIDKDGNYVASTKVNGSTVYLHDMVGGLVGYADKSTTISDSYNANAVLSGYTESVARTTNYVAGGIVGYAAGQTDECVQLLHNYNTGFVGAGNYYSPSNYAFAGGIVGYGVNVNMDSNVNDAGIEALSDMTPSRTNQIYSIDVKLSEDNKGKLEDNNGINADGYATGSSDTSGNSKDEVWTKENAYFSENHIEKVKQGNQKPLESLKFDITLTYNPGKSRQVYAYGIGFVVDGVQNNNSTSTDNIKNDGCIGQVVETKSITFDRQAMYRGNVSEESVKDALQNVWASFDARTRNVDGSIETGEEKSGYKYYVNGYDSYGIPMHIYKTDYMTRTYGRILEDVSVTATAKELEAVYGTTTVPGWENSVGVDGIDYCREGYVLGEDYKREYHTLSCYKESYTIVDNDIFNQYKTGVHSTTELGVSYYYKGIFNKFNDGIQASAYSFDKYGSVTNYRYSMLDTPGDQTFDFNNIRKNFLGNKQNEQPKAFDSYTVGGEGFRDGLILSHDDFLMKQTTEYAEGVTFAGYDKILTGEEVKGVDGNTLANTGFGRVLMVVDSGDKTFEAIDNPTTDADTSTEAQDKIDDINKKTGVEGEDEDATINGEKTQIVRSSQGLSTILDSSGTVNVVLESDQNIGNIASGKSNTIFGGEHIVKMTTRTGYILKDYGANISDVKLMVVGSFNSAGDTLISATHAISGLTLYGNIRNVINDQSLYTMDASGDVDVTSFLCINGLDGEEGTISSINGDSAASFLDAVTITDPDDNNAKYESRNILIVGDGGNGANGKDAESSNDRPGNGGYSGFAGVVGVQKDFAGFVKAGVNGVPGFGGNAKNNSSVVIKGGNAGKVVSSGTGDITDDIVEPTNVAKRTMQEITQYNGNSGTKQLEAAPKLEEYGNTSYTYNGQEGAWGAFVFGNVTTGAFSSTDNAWWEYRDDDDNYNGVTTTNWKTQIESNVHAWKADDFKVYVSLKTGEKGDSGSGGVYQWRGVIWTSGESWNWGNELGQTDFSGKTSTGDELKQYGTIEVIGEDAIPAAWKTEQTGITSMVKGSFNPGKMYVKTGQYAELPTIKVILPWHNTAHVETQLQFDGVHWKTRGSVSVPGFASTKILTWIDDAGSSGTWQLTKDDGTKVYYDPYNDLGVILVNLLDTNAFNNHREEYMWVQEDTSGITETTGSATRNIYKTAYSITVSGVKDELEETFTKTYGLDNLEYQLKDTVKLYRIVDSAAGNLNGKWVADITVSALNDKHSLFYYDGGSFHVLRYDGSIDEQNN